jgi:hypothetical protein
MYKFQFNFKTKKNIIKKTENKEIIIKEIIENLNTALNVYVQMIEITNAFEDNIMSLINKVQNEGKVSYVVVETFDNYLTEFINRLTSCLKTQMSSQFGSATEIIKRWDNTYKTYKYNATIRTSMNIDNQFEQLICEIDNIGMFNYMLNHSNEIIITNDIRLNNHNNDEPVIIKFGKNMSYELKNSNMMNLLHKTENKFSEIMERYITCVLSSFHDQINKNNDIIKSSIKHMKHIDGLF